MPRVRPGHAAPRPRNRLRRGSRRSPSVSAPPRRRSRASRRGRARRRCARSRAAPASPRAAARVCAAQDVGQARRWRRASCRSSRQAATRLAPATRPAIIDLVAATERSGPAHSGSSSLGLRRRAARPTSLTSASGQRAGASRRALHLDDVGAAARLRDRDARRALRAAAARDKARRSRGRSRRRARPSTISTRYFR